MASQAGPGPGKRYRCEGCGNLTRFDIESVERVRQFWHAELSGDGRVESEEQLDRRVESVVCPWCGTGARVAVVDTPSAEALVQARS